MDTQTFTFASSHYVPIAIGFFGLATGYFIWGGQALFGFPKPSPEVDRWRWSSRRPVPVRDWHLAPLLHVCRDGKPGTRGQSVDLEWHPHDKCPETPATAGV
jgi:hypothetical protein